MSSSTSSSDRARQEITQLLATWGVGADPATAEVISALEARDLEKTRRSAAAAPPPTPPAPAPVLSPRSVTPPTPAKVPAATKAPATPPAGSAPTPAPSAGPASTPASISSPRPRRRASARPPVRTSLRAWVFLLAPVVTIAVVLAGLAAWNARAATGEMVISLEKQSPRSMESMQAPQKEQE